MELKIFFDTVDQSLFQDNVDPSTFYNNIKVYSETLPDWRNADIAIIGLSENRGTIENIGVEKAADAIRKKLYNLKKGAGAYKIVDLGNLRCGVRLEETYLRIKEIGETLMKNNVIPIFIGGSHDLDYGQYMAYESFEKLVSLVNVDASLDMEGSDFKGFNKHHTHKILVHEPNFLFNFSNIASQAYLNESSTIEVLDKLNFENLRIGYLKEKFEEVEPVLRQADMLSFDMTSIRHADSPANTYTTPFGLSAEESCQICWYAGLNNKLSSVGIYEYNPELDTNNQSSFLAATMIWYFIEGFYHRRADFDFMGDLYTKYIVEFNNMDQKMNFYKNNLSEKWWIEVPFPKEKKKYARVSIIPCSYSDYQKAVAGELPYRWIKTHAKLI